MKTVNVSLVGVGGQGIILTADILAKTAALAGYDVKKSEIHGMAQRGGSVTSQVRFGDSVASPIIQEGTADVLVSFDKLEAVRNAGVLAADGVASAPLQSINRAGRPSLTSYPNRSRNVVRKQSDQGVPLRKY